MSRQYTSTARNPTAAGVAELVANRPTFFDMKPAWQTTATPINDFICMSEGCSNSYMLVTSAGRVIINTGMGFEAPVHKRVFDQACDGPTTHIITTQGHVDHLGGVSRFREADTAYIAQANNAACQHDDSRIATVRVNQSGTWFQHVFDYATEVAARDPSAFEQDVPEPDITFEDRLELDCGGLKLELLAVPGGETADSCLVWLPEHGILFSGNTVGPLFPHFPNINTIRGDRYRFLEPYMRAVDRMRSLEPELLVTGHFAPIAGRELIRDSLDQLYRAADHVHGATLAGMNEGKDVSTLMREVDLPDDVVIGQGYGKVSWAVRTIWESYMGWFKAGSTTELYPTPAREVSAELAGLAGVNAITTRGRALLDAGNPEAALHLAELAAAADTADDNDKAALQLLLDVHLALRERASVSKAGANFWEDGWLAKEIARLQSLLGHS
ncbi:MAG TPA: MBL fold metallo-hydrolase [candidate division UBP10 bacterium]|nr:MBL fold metallo-hydrolase [Candidatus Binatota bacterium]